MGRWEKRAVTGDVDLVGREELELLATARLPIKRMLRRKEQSMGTTRSWRWVRSVVISVDSGGGAEEALGAPECGANSAAGARNRVRENKVGGLSGPPRSVGCRNAIGEGGRQRRWMEADWYAGKVKVL
jgi:hypothetical protein